MLGFEPRSHMYYMNNVANYATQSLLYPFFKSVFLQRVQILALSPEGKIPHWRLGFFRFFGEGLYLDINLLYFLPIIDFFPQIAQILGIVLLSIEYIRIVIYFL